MTDNTARVKRAIALEFAPDDPYAESDDKPEIQTLRGGMPVEDLPLAQELDQELFMRDPGEYTLLLVEQGIISPDDIMLAVLKYMQHCDVRIMLDTNELSPRFVADDDTEGQDSDSYAEDDDDADDEYLEWRKARSI